MIGAEFDAATIGGILTAFFGGLVALLIGIGKLVKALKADNGIGHLVSANAKQINKLADTATEQHGSLRALESSVAYIKDKADEHGKDIKTLLRKAGA